ncbi:MAG: alanine dehydrogenase, partial [Pseudomonadales bacterium]|nr:alanine dehydrogenase [Pseudomonadales bacterium]
MIIGVPREIKTEEYRVGLTPHAVHELALHGHRLLVERGAGLGSGFGDDDYQRAGATLIDSAAEIWARAALIVKVKEPQPGERDMLREGQALFTYLHLAPDPQQTAELLERKVIGIAYETVTSASGGLPLLAPMSEVAGRLSVQVGAHCLQRPEGGRGVLLGGVP